MADNDRRVSAGIPADVALASKGELARRMSARAFAVGVPVAQVPGDTALRSRRAAALVGGVGAARALADARFPMPGRGCRRGPRWYDWACLAPPYAAADGRARWLLARRGVHSLAERVYSGVHVPADTAPAAMVRAVECR